MVNYGLIKLLTKKFEEEIVELKKTTRSTSWWKKHFKDESKKDSKHKVKNVYTVKIFKMQQTKQYIFL
jgi:hypothetical protein